MTFSYPGPTFAQKDAGTKKRFPRQAFSPRNAQHGPGIIFLFLSEYEKFFIVRGRGRLGALERLGATPPLTLLSPDLCRAFLRMRRTSGGLERRSDRRSPTASRRLCSDQFCFLKRLLEKKNATYPRAWPQGFGQVKLAFELPVEPVVHVNVHGTFCWVHGAW